MPATEVTDARAFKTLAELDAWLAKNHAKKDELWVRMYRKGTGTPSIRWEDCVVACLTWGWIDGVRRGIDEETFGQRLTPRRPKSLWSKRNCDIAEALIAAGTMQPSGLVHVEAAKKDGRWEAAYAGPATATIDPAFEAALNKNKAAKTFFATLSKANLYSIYWRIQTAKKPETKAKRITEIVAKLAKGEKYH